MKLKLYLFPIFNHRTFFTVRLYVEVLYCADPETANVKSLSKQFCKTFVPISSSYSCAKRYRSVESRRSKKLNHAWSTKDKRREL